MTKILLISEDYIKSNSNLSSNVWGKFLLPAIREAQDIDLQAILGTGLYEAILSKVENGTITEVENENYKKLLDDHIQPYLLYQVLTNVLPIIGTKLSNLGAMKTEDEKAYNISSAERERLESYYQYRTDFYGKRMQDYLCKHRGEFKELGSTSCHQMKSNLHSMSNCPIWLGGKRGR